MVDQCGLHLRPGSPARRWGPGKGGCSAPSEVFAVEGEALGRSRGGLTSKVHLAVDGRGLPLSVIVGPGQGGDEPQLLPLLDAIRVPRIGPGRPRKRPDHVIADKAYSHPSTRRALRRRGIGHTIPEKSDQLAHRAFARLKQFRALATRYAKRAAYYRSTSLLVTTVLRLR